MTGGYNVVIALDEDAAADEMIAAYAAQFESSGFEGTISRTIINGSPALAARHSIAGGGKLEAVVVDDNEAGRAFLLLSRAND